MRHWVDDLLYDEMDETWWLNGKPEGRMSRGAALQIVNYVRRCEENARREFAEVVRLSAPKEPT